MRTPKLWSDNLKKKIITDDMLESALFSVNKRAKNFRDKRREYSHYRYATHDYAGIADAKMNEMYRKKDVLLTLLSPVCIHVEYQRNRNGNRVEIGNKVDPYLKYIYTGEINHYGSYIRRNDYDYYDPFGEEVVFFDHVKEPFQKAYYLFRVLGTHSFHTPIAREDVEKYKNLPVIAIDHLDTSGEEILELCSMQFVDKLIDLIKSGDFVFDHKDRADEAYIKNAESVDVNSLIQKEKKENTDEAVFFFGGMIADAMGKAAKPYVLKNAVRETPTEEELARWKKKARKLYNKDINTIQKYLDRPSKKNLRKAEYAEDKLKTGKTSVFVEVKVRAYDKQELNVFIRKSADIFFGDPNVTVEKLVQAYPPDVSSCGVLRNEEKVASDYIVSEYARLAKERRGEFEQMLKEVEKKKKETKGKK